MFVVKLFVNDTHRKNFLAASHRINCHESWLKKESLMFANSINAIYLFIMCQCEHTLVILHCSAVTVGFLYSFPYCLLSSSTSLFLSCFALLYDFTLPRCLPLFHVCLLSLSYPCTIYKCFLSSPSRLSLFSLVSLMSAPQHLQTLVLIACFLSTLLCLSIYLSDYKQAITNIYVLNSITSFLVLTAKHQQHQ